MKPARSADGPGVLDLAEESVHVLRQARAETWVAYYLGTVPFALSLLFFWAEMAQSARGLSACAPAALGVALWFLWMKVWQARFGAALSAQVAGREVERWTLGRWLRVAAVQGAIQPWRLLLLPLALVSVLPFGATLACFENATVLGIAADGRGDVVMRRAWRQARLWRAKNHLLALVLLLVGGVVFLNVFVAAVQLPMLARTLLGIETAYTREGWNAGHSTFLAVCASVTWLLVDPLVKAVHVLRCFHGESRRTGEDLRADLRGLKAVAGRTALWLAAALVWSSGGGGSVEAASATEDPPTAVVRPDALGSTMEKVFQEPEFTWRFPRESMDREARPDGLWSGLVGALADAADAGWRTIRRWGRAALDFLGDVVMWIRDRLFSRDRSTPSAGGGMRVWEAVLPSLLVVLLAAMAAMAAVLIVRHWRRRPAAEMAAEPVVAVPDLQDERTQASEWPEDEWLRLARELADRGEWRLSLRAWHLATLAHLAERGLVTLARHKSNRDYLIELGRRGRGLPAAVVAFGELVGVIDRVWYGRHDVDRAMLDTFHAEVERIRAC